MPLVVDSSVTAAWILPDERTPAALKARSQVLLEGGLVPAHWWYETRNTLLMAERRNRTTEALNALALSTLVQLPIVQTQPHDDAKIFAVARRHRLTFYDAAYLELAAREKVALATFDSELARAASAEGVSLLIES